MPSAVVKLVKQSTNNPHLEGSNMATDGLRQKVQKMKQKDAYSSSIVGIAINCIQLPMAQAEIAAKKMKQKEAISSSKVGKVINK
jgi:hypothetical protein